MSAAAPLQDAPVEPAGSPLRDAVLHAFAAGGALSQADERYTEREVQVRMALAIAAAIEERRALVAEAGTGVGKTFAYLVPTLLSGARALISTATKSLQDQLFLRDLPRLREALQLPVTVALLKGRASYLCLHRLDQARHSAQLPDRWAVRTLAKVEQWARTTASGDLAEMEGLDERSSVIPLVTSSRENCLGTECPAYRQCHVMKARREAMAADLVVVNHHLFFADMALRDSGVAELLPSVEVAVFDEAHQLAEAGVQFLGTTLGSGQVIDFARDVVAAGLQQARGLAPWQDLAAQCDRAARDLRIASAGALREVRGTIKLRWEERAPRAEFIGRRSTPSARSRPTSSSWPSAPRSSPRWRGAFAKRPRMGTCAGST
jgi:ATP-dependent DNA helicase DinG